MSRTPLFVNPDTKEIDVGLLADRMTDRWKSFGNVPNDSLIATWEQIGATFNDKLTEYDTPYANRWHVLQPETGTGKTESTKMYAAMCAEARIGMLIVTRLTDEADILAGDINEIAGRKVATARHWKSKMTNVEAGLFPILVVTHSALLGAMEDEADETLFVDSRHGDLAKWTGLKRREQSWKSLSAYAGDPAKKRRLIVIDESLSVMDIARVDAASVAWLRGNVYKYRNDYPVAYHVLETYEQAKPNTTHVTTAEEWLTKDAEEAYQELLKLAQVMEHWRYVGTKKHADEGANQRQKRRARKVFKNLLRHIEAHFILQYSKAGSPSFTTARHLIPDEHQGVVVLDATASVNPLYSVLSREKTPVLLKPRIIGARTYANVRIHASRGHRVGKTYMEVAGNHEVKRLIQALIAEYEARAATDRPMKSVLVVCHKVNEPRFAGYELPFELHVGHWGAIDGRNGWQHCDSVVLFGVPYRHPSDAAAVYTDLQDVQPGESLDGPVEHGGFPDIEKALSQGWVLSDMIQAVNRIRCRRVIDTQGNCDTADVYLALPHREEVANHMLREISGQMPEATVFKWNLDAAKAKTGTRVRRSKHEESLTAFVKSLEAGSKWSASDVRKELNITAKATWDRLVKRLKNQDTDLGKVMVECGVRYETTRHGRIYSSHLIKG